MTQELKNALQAALDWIDAVPKDIQLPAMPGFDREYVEELLQEKTTAPMVKLDSSFGCIKTLRDEFAMAALSGMLSDSNCVGTYESIVKHAYGYADAMLKERAK